MTPPTFPPEVLGPPAKRYPVLRLVLAMQAALVEEYNALDEPSHPRARKLARLIDRVERYVRRLPRESAAVAQKVRAK